MAFLALVLSGSTAVAASREPKAMPQRLWEAYPLNPPGEQIAPRDQARADRSALPTRAPPVMVRGLPDEAQAAETPSRSGHDVLFGLLAGMGLLALLVVVSFGSMRMRQERSARVRHLRYVASARGSTSAPPGRGAGLARLVPRGGMGRIAQAEGIHAKLLPGRDFHRIPPRAREGVWIIALRGVGCALAILFALLTVRYVA